MRFLILSWLLTGHLITAAQKIMTCDASRDILARRDASGELSLAVPPKILLALIGESMPQLTEIELLGIRQLGRSSFLIIRGQSKHQEAGTTTAAILLVETTPGAFQLDQLVISCSSTGSCRECSMPPNCQCSNGEGSCSTQTYLLAQLARVTVIIDE